MKTLVDRNGQVQLGVFDSSPENINFEDFDYRNDMGKPIAGWRKRMKVNQFQFIGLTGDDFILGVAIINLKWASNCFVYIYQPSSQSFREFSWLHPFSMGCNVSQQPNAGEYSFKHGDNHISIHAEQGVRTLKIDIPQTLSVDVQIDENADYNPLAICTRAGYSGWVFTQKACARNVSGSISWQDNNIEVESLLASVDWSGGYMRRDTFWLWSSLSCKTQRGDKIGLNLSAGVNETCYTENALWVNDSLIGLSQAQFVFDRHNRKGAWKITTSDGRVDLVFEVQGERKEKINAGFMASNFTQLFGRFYGTVKDESGTLHKIDGATGFCEDHYAKW